ncbi:tautomerase family protein [Aureimonas altamirensis]|uniref:tautomerase family protein n=1 Tax=Aureimonas altamirensis TaxID=370622 RepID=UPI0030185DA8
MPHVIVKLRAGRDEATRRALTDHLTAAVTETLGVGPDSVSVLLQDVEGENWMSEVYGPNIEANADRLTKRPGYGPLAEQDAL